MTLRPFWRYYGSALEAMLHQRAGNTGELVHNNPPRYDFRRACPFCGCRSWFYFDNGDGDAQAMDVFECLRCLATSTRLDSVGVEEWKEMQERRKAEKEG